MVTKQILIILLLFIGLSSCISKECKDEPSSLNFELQVNYSPIQDTFQVGDTLNVRSNFSDLLSDRAIGVSQEVKDFSFFSTIILRLSVDDNVIPLNIDSSQIITGSDTSYEPISYSDDSFGIYVEKHSYKNNKYDFQIQLVLQDTGLYSILTISDLGITTSTRQQRYEGQCANQLLFAEYKVNNGDAYENNLELLEESSLYEGIRDFNFNRSGGFAFYVKE